MVAKRRAAKAEEAGMGALDCQFLRMAGAGKERAVGWERRVRRSWTKEAERFPVQREGWSLAGGMHGGEGPEADFGAGWVVEPKAAGGVQCWSMRRRMGSWRGRRWKP